MPLRALALVMLLVGPALSGCFDADEGEILARPTDTSPGVPTTRAPTGPTVRFNTSDPGYRVDAPWRLGDGWDYASNGSSVRRVRVIDQRLLDDSTKFLLETTDLGQGGAVERVVRAWVDPRTWVIVNETDASGGVDRYQPGLPVRFWRNATASYAHERADARGATIFTENVTIASRLYGTHQTLLFPWGYVEAKKVEHLTTARSPGGERREGMTTYWVHSDYLNAVQFQLPDGELFKLTAARAGDFRRGQLA